MSDNLRIVEGAVSGTSSGRTALTEPFSGIGGFTPRTLAHVMLTGWAMEFTYGDHPLYQQHVWLQWDDHGTWVYGIPVVNDDGTVVGRYVVELGSENMDNPFTCKINFAVIGV